jgi:hypothetical protein
MSLIVDRDLVVIEPSLFVDAEDIGTVLAAGTDGSLSGTTLTSASVDFEAAGIDEGHVASVGDEIVEVIARPGASSLTVSRPRMDEEGPTIPPAAGSGMKFTVVTFDRQIASAQAWALGALGIDAHDPVNPLDENAVVNPDELGNVVALRTICDVFASAAARQPTEASLAARAAMYRERLRRAMTTTNILLDLNGDGVADAARRLSTVVLARS